MGDELPNCRKELAPKRQVCFVRRCGVEEKRGKVIRMCSFSVLCELEAKFLKGRLAILTHEEKCS